MKIAITCYPTYGGSGVVASELAMALAKRGHEIHVVSYKVPGKLDISLKNIHYHCVTVPDYPLFEYPPYSLALASHLAEISTRFNLDIIHAHYAIPHAASAVLAREMTGKGVKVVTTLHGTDITLVGRDKSFLPITRYAIEQSDALTAVSMFLRDEVCCRFSCEKTIEVIYNFIHPDAVKKSNGKNIRSCLAPNGEKLLVHASNYRKVKRVDDVYRIFKTLCDSGENLKLLLVGTGPLLADILGLAKEDGLDEKIVVFGEQREIYDILAAADVLLLPSASESFGLVALEAMACGTPPVASDVGGLPELIDHGKTGFLVPVGDVNLMSEYVKILLSDEKLYKKIANSGKKRALAQFNIKSVVDQYEKLYIDTLQTVKGNLS